MAKVDSYFSLESDRQIDLRDAIDATELKQLAEEWGDVPLVHHELSVDHPFLSGDQQRLISDGRRAEICYVMHRGISADGVLLHIKTVYPSGAYRLPTGGIHQGESVLGTLVREIYEETGLIVGENVNQVRVEQFLGVISYRLRHRKMGSFNFATYPFLVRMPVNAKLKPQDPKEQIGGWRWRTPAQLQRVARLLEEVQQVDPQWTDWGRYRAHIHRFVATQLT